MVAFAVGTDCRLHPAWQAVEGPNGVGPFSTPTVVDGVVYWGVGAGGQLVAVDEDTGRRLWSSGHTLTGAVFAPAIVTDGMLFAASWDGPGHADLLAFDV
jgi:outer membrane protein assembly factor BamB